MSTQNQQDRYLLYKKPQSKHTNNYDMFSTSKYVQHEEGNPEPLHIGNLNDMQIASIKNDKDSIVSKTIRGKIKEYGTFTDKDINNIIDEHEKYYGEIEEREGTSEFYKDKPEDGTKADLLFAQASKDKIQKRDELIKAVENFVSSDGKTALDTTENVKQDNKSNNNNIETNTDQNSKEEKPDQNYFYDDDIKGEDNISPYDLLYLYRGTPAEDLLREEINKERDKKIARNEQSDYDFSKRIENILRSVDSEGSNYNVINESKSSAHNDNDKYFTNSTNQISREYVKSDNLLESIENKTTVSTSVEDYFKSRNTSQSTETLDKTQTAKLNNIRGHIPTSTAFDLYSYRGKKLDIEPKRYNTKNEFDKFSLYSGKEYNKLDDNKDEELLKNGVMAKALGKK